MGQNSRRRSRRDGGQGDALLGLEAESPQAIQETPFDFAGMRLNQNRKPLQVRAKLIA